MRNPKKILFWCAFLPFMLCIFVFGSLASLAEFFILVYEKLMNTAHAFEEWCLEHEKNTGLKHLGDGIYTSYSKDTDADI